MSLKNFQKRDNLTEDAVECRSIYQTTTGENLVSSY